MLKFDSETKEVAAKGTLLDITADFLCIMGVIYKEYLEQNPETAELYKKIVMAEVNDKAFWREIEEETKKSPN